MKISPYGNQLENFRILLLFFLILVVVIFHPYYGSWISRLLVCRPSPSILWNFHVPPLCAIFFLFFFVLISRSLQSLNIHPTSPTLQQRFSHSPERKDSAQISDFTRGASDFIRLFIATIPRGKSLPWIYGSNFSESLWVFGVQICQAQKSVRLIPVSLCLRGALLLVAVCAYGMAPLTSLFAERVAYVSHVETERKIGKIFNKKLFPPFIIHCIFHILQAFDSCLTLSSIN